MTPDVTFIPGFLTKQEADQLLAGIKAEADFKQNDSSYPGKKRPRLEAWYGSWDYQYGRGSLLKTAPMPDYLQPIIDKIAAAGIGTYNAVLINLYRDGSDYVSPHSDDDYGDPFPTIPSLTLATARPFRFRLKKDRSVTVEYLPQHGDLLVMNGRTNSEWLHEVPKTAKKVGERINLTFRNRQ